MKDAVREKLMDRIRADIQDAANVTTASLERHLESKRESVRRDIWALYWRESLASVDARLRTTVVRLMLRELPDESPMIQGQLAKWLQEFQKLDFDAASRDLLLKSPWSSDFAPQVIRLLGIAEVREARPRLERELQEGSLMNDAGAAYFDTTWAAMLALSRLGNDTALQRVIRQVKQERDIIVRATVLFPDLAYTLRRPAFEALAAYTNSQERLPELRSGEPGRLEAAYAAAAFARGVRDFPFQDPDLTERQVVQARAWIDSHVWELK